MAIAKQEAEKKQASKKSSTDMQIAAIWKKFETHDKELEMVKKDNADIRKNNDNILKDYATLNAKYTKLSSVIGRIQRRIILDQGRQRLAFLYPQALNPVALQNLQIQFPATAALMGHIHGLLSAEDRGRLSLATITLMYQPGYYGLERRGFPDNIRGSGNDAAHNTERSDLEEAATEVGLSTAASLQEILALVPHETNNAE
ncbi:hypothetical protein C8J56DRAFT_364353 [Mycena floridula]|nr:hypothetical protein C8J56DRAFT_364353 [Mycena floridula]